MIQFACFNVIFFPCVPLLHIHQIWQLVCHVSFTKPYVRLICNLRRSLSVNSLQKVRPTSEGEKKTAIQSDHMTQRKKIERHISCCPMLFEWKVLLLIIFVIYFCCPFCMSLVQVYIQRMFFLCCFTHFFTLIRSVDRQNWR